jgi:uncharacterized repeat protein (TIGR01451 family)
VSPTQVRVRLTNVRGGSGTLAVRLPTGWAVDQAGNQAPQTDSPLAFVTGSRLLRLAAAGPAVARSGATIAYLVAWRNAGTQQADGAELIVALPVGTTFDAARSSFGWTAIGNGKYRLDLGNLAAGAHGRARFAVQVGSAVPAAGRLAFGVSITDDLAGGLPIQNRSVLSRLGRGRIGAPIT